MIRKATIICLIIISSFLPALAQNNWDIGWPYMPSRDTNHTHIIRQYTIDSSGRRKLIQTTEYDRYGYQTGPNIHLTYNNKGQLVRRVELISISSTKNPLPHQDTLEICDINYNSLGHPETIYWVYYSNYGTNITKNFVYHKLEQNIKDSLCQKLRYRTTNISTEDTFTYTATAVYRCFDNQGRLIQYGNDVISAEDTYFRISYTYDNAGRITTREGTYWEYTDSLTYHYDNGKLTSITGKGYDLGSELDIKIDCYPDGRYKEEWRRYREWQEEDEDYTKMYNEHILYDTHGEVIRFEVGSNTLFEFEREYWE